MERRFYCEPPLENRATLRGDEAQHLAKVLRARVGEEVQLFDGTGYEYAAVVERIGRSDVELTVLRRAQVNRELSIELHVGAALPRGDRQKWLVEKAVELGVSTLTPLFTKHGVVQPQASATERLERQVIEASKQCRRNRLMQIRPPQDVTIFCQSAPETALRAMAHPDAQWSQRDLPRLFAESGSQAIYVAIGPEGGFTDDEVAAALALGWRSVSLGPRVLRVETAVIMLAVIAATWS
jgi:16S rRNA (uracil1498-N3)-methyltransferase